MCAKKKAIPSKMWRIAGEPLRSQPISAVEQAQFAKGFYICRLPYCAPILLEQTSHS